MRKTTVQSVLTPISDVKPTAAEMLNDVWVSNSVKMPPIAPNGSVAQHDERVTEGLEEQVQQQQHISARSER